MAPALRLSDVLGEIWASAMPTAERRRLAARTVEAALRGCGGPRGGEEAFEEKACTRQGKVREQSMEMQDQVSDNRAHTPVPKCSPRPLLLELQMADEVPVLLHETDKFARAPLVGPLSRRPRRRGTCP